MRQTLGWTARGDDGEKLDVEATLNRNQWTFKRRANRNDPWETYEPRVPDWEALVDLLDRKYRRRRCAWREVEQATEFLEKAKERG